MSATVEVDVVVIGAGVSGLISAYHLKKKDPNLRVVVLEAKDRVGGRTLLHELKAANGTRDVWDFGGQWVGSCQLHVMGLLEELGLEVYPQHTEGRKVMQLGDHKVRTYTSDIPSMNIVALLDLHRIITKVEKWQMTVPIEDPGLSPDAELFDGMTMDEALRSYGWTQSMRDAMDAAFRCIFGAELNEMSLLYFLSYCNAAGGINSLIESKKGSGQEFKIKGGAGQIARLLAERVGEDVRLGHPVRSIVQNKDDVTVTTSTGLTFSCSRVIMSTPPNQTVKMEFQPMLPTEKLHVLQNMPVGYIIKIIITYEKAFWREAGFSGEIVTNGGPACVDGVTTGPLCICYDATSNAGNPALVGFIGGKQQREYNLLSAEDRQCAVIESLSSFFGPEVANFIDYWEKDWGLEPFSDGGPVCVGKPGMMPSALRGLRQPFDRVHFGGTESATTWCGFINGAIQTGYRAANEVLYNLRPQAVTSNDLAGTCYDPVTKRPPTPRAAYSPVTKFVMSIGAVCLVGLFVRRFTNYSWVVRKSRLF